MVVTDAQSALDWIATAIGLPMEGRDSFKECNSQEQARRILVCYVNGKEALDTAENVIKAQDGLIDALRGGFRTVAALSSARKALIDSMLAD